MKGEDEKMGKQKRLREQLVLKNNTQLAMRWTLAKNLLIEPFLFEIIEFLNAYQPIQASSLEQYLIACGITSRSKAFRLIRKWTGEGIIKSKTEQTKTSYILSPLVKRQFKDICWFLRIENKLVETKTVIEVTTDINNEFILDNALF